MNSPILIERYFQGISFFGKIFIYFSNIISSCMAEGWKKCTKIQQRGTWRNDDVHNCGVSYWCCWNVNLVRGIQSGHVKFSQLNHHQVHRVHRSHWSHRDHQDRQIWVFSTVSSSRAVSSAELGCQNLLQILLQIVLSRNHRRHPWNHKYLSFNSSISSQQCYQCYAGVSWSYNMLRLASYYRCTV